jgi:hypothetical protein
VFIIKKIFFSEETHPVRESCPHDLALCGAVTALVLFAVKKKFWARGSAEAAD